MHFVCIQKEVYTPHNKLNPRNINLRYLQGITSYVDLTNPYVLISIKSQALC